MATWSSHGQGKAGPYVQATWLKALEGPRSKGPVCVHFSSSFKSASRVDFHEASALEPLKKETCVDSLDRMFRIVRLPQESCADAKSRSLLTVILRELG